MGNGVGLRAANVGVRVGAVVGALDGINDGEGVGFPGA